MYCKKCGAEIPDNALVCEKCGTPVQPYDSAGQRAREQEAWQQSRAKQERFSSEGCAKASLVVAILSILSFMIPYLTIPVSLVSIVLGVMGMRTRYRRRAIAAIVIGGIMALTGVVLMICLSALNPYTEDLMNMLTDYIGQ